jgi:cell division protein FtsI/penicillin-binding protein 2
MANARPMYRHATVRLKSQELRRMGCLGAGLALGGALVAARVVQLQVFQHDALFEAGMRRRLRRRPLLAKRGAILDRHGKPLAQSQICCHIAVDPTRVREPDTLARLLTKRLGGNSTELQAQMCKRNSRDAATCAWRPARRLNATKRCAQTSKPLSDTYGATNDPC